MKTITKRILKCEIKMIKEIQKRLDNASEGPWWVKEKGSNIVVMPEKSELGAGNRYMACGGGNNENNADFAAHAPADIKWLLDEVKRLENKVDHVCENCIHWGNKYPAVGIGKGACPHDSKEHEPDDNCNKCEV